LKLSEYVFGSLKTCWNKHPFCDAPLDHFFCIRENHIFTMIRVVCTKGHCNIIRIENRAFKELQLPHEQEQEQQHPEEEAVVHV